MGQWNTLHLFDDRKFYDEVVPSMQSKDILKKCFASKEGRYALEDAEILVKERVEVIQELSSKLSLDFRVHSGLVRDLKNCINREEKVKVSALYSNKAEDFNNILLVLIFSKCALCSPYFTLGYRLITSYLKYRKSDSICENYVKKLMYFEKSGTLISLGTGDGIRNWLTAEEVKIFVENYEDIIPNKRERYAKRYIKEFKTFFELAAKNNYGLLACLDLNEGLYAHQRPIGQEINWQKYQLENLIYVKHTI